MEGQCKIIGIGRTQTIEIHGESNGRSNQSVRASNRFNHRSHTISPSANKKPDGQQFVRRPGGRARSELRSRPLTRHECSFD